MFDSSVWSVSEHQDGAVIERLLHTQDDYIPGDSSLLLRTAHSLTSLIIQQLLGLLEKVAISLKISLT